MAEIFFAERRGAMDFRREVCIKRIRPNLCGDTAFVQMFIDEARISSRLRHSNIVAIDDFGSADGQLYICMEWVHGVDVSRLLRRLDAEGRRLPVDAALFILSEVLRGLEYAHGKRDDGVPLDIVHRDVTPHNVLVSYAGEVKLSDFGIAKATSRLHHTAGDLVKGKLAYMAPEQATGKRLDGRTDLFALGICAFEMLTGRRPFAGRDRDAVINMLRGDRAPLHSLRADVPAALERWVDRMLQLPVEQRFPNAAAALDALQTIPFATGARSLSSLLAELYPDEASVIVPAAAAPAATVRTPAFEPWNDPPAPVPAAPDDETETVTALAPITASVSTDRDAPTTAPVSKPPPAPGSAPTPPTHTWVGLAETIPSARTPATSTPAARTRRVAVAAVAVAVPAAAALVVLRPAPTTTAPPQSLRAASVRVTVAAPAPPRPAPVAPTTTGTVAPPPARPAIVTEAATPTPATLVVTVRPWGRVTVDGHAIVAGHAEHVAPGAHTLAATQGSGRTATRRVDLAPGSTTHLQLVIPRD